MIHFFFKSRYLKHKELSLLINHFGKQITGFMHIQGGLGNHIKTFEPRREKTNNLGFRTGPTQTELYKHRRWLEAGNFGFSKQRNCTKCLAKTKALISFEVTAKLICVFVFAYADCWFSRAVAHFQVCYSSYEEDTTN